MSDFGKRLAVRTIKPLVSERLWQRLRSRGHVEAPTNKSPQQQRHERLQAMNLTELAREFKTDKAGIHKYTQHYERHLVHLKDERFTMLEIGIGGYSRSGQGGASLKMWKHFFPHAQIVGLDIEDKSFVEQRRIQTVQGSQVDEALLHRLVEEHGPFQVIIDDGSHRPEHIRETFRILFPLLADDGIYAIEDTQTSYWPEFGGQEDRHADETTMSLVKDLVDGLNYEEFLDESYEPTYSDTHVIAVHAYHNLVILEKGVNQEGTNKRRALKKRYASGTDSDATKASASS